MKVLIVGAGIGGPTLAYWLARYGIEPKIVEKAPRQRTGGYIVDFWGVGYDVAERMRLLPEIRRNGYFVEEVRAVDRNGKKVASFPVTAFSRVTHGRFVSIPRADLAATIYAAIEGKVETIFGDSVASIEQGGANVHVTFERGSEREFDLVVGTDGLHSRVREIVFGPQDRFEKYLGYKVAAFAVEGYRPRDDSVYVMYTQIRQMAARFAMRGDRTMFLFTFAEPASGGSEDVPAQKALLHKRFGNRDGNVRKFSTPSTPPAISTSTA